MGRELAENLPWYRCDDDDEIEVGDVIKNAGDEVVLMDEDTAAVAEGDTSNASKASDMQFSISSWRTSDR